MYIYSRAKHIYGYVYVLYVLLSMLVSTRYHVLILFYFQQSYQEFEKSYLLFSLCDIPVTKAVLYLKTLS